jgi:hypothetical protein
MFTVPDARPAAKVHPGVPEPIYEPYLAGDHGDDVGDDEDGGRELRDSVSASFHQLCAGSEVL